jgi:hypothetical protein
MKTIWRKIAGAIFLSAAVGGLARAEVIQPGLGNAWLNTPVAWSEEKGIYLGAGSPQVSRDSGTSFKIAGAYATGRGEVSVGYLSFDDASDTRVSGFAFRYTISPPESAAVVSLLAGAQTTRAKSSGSDSTSVAGILAGQRFSHGGGISLGFFYWTDVGTTADGARVGEDTEVTANIGVALSPTWKGFVEGYTFNEAERAGYSLGFTADLAPGITMLIGHTFITQPRDDQVTELYFSYKFR